MPEQYGQPVFPDERLATVVLYSWLLEHNHQTRWPDDFVTSSGFKFPFLLGCHSFAIWGNKNFKLFSLLTLWPEQYGQLEPIVLSDTTFLYSWPLEHNHQTFLPEPLVTSSGLRFPFLLGCHSFAKLGNRNFILKQPGQILPFFLLTIVDSHSCPLEHNHQTRWPDDFVTSSGFKFPFLLGCHSFAKFGNENLKLFSFVTFCPEQYGQLLPCFLLVILDSHSWPLLHNHQTFSPLPIEKESGVNG